MASLVAYGDDDSDEEEEKEATAVVDESKIVDEEQGEVGLLKQVAEDKPALPADFFDDAGEAAKVTTAKPATVAGKSAVDVEFE